MRVPPGQWEGAGDWRSRLLTGSQCSEQPAAERPGRLWVVSLDSSSGISARNREAAAYLLLNIEVGSPKQLPEEGDPGGRLVTLCLLLDCL